jgi:hypothetical protein
MQKHMRMLGVLVMTCTGLVGWSISGAAAGAPSSSPPNWDQGDRTVFWECTKAPDGFALIPDLQAELTTSGGPF